MDINRESILRIVQGDQYAIPFPIYLGTEVVTPDNVAGVRIQLNDDLREWPNEDDSLTYDAERQVWCWPLTEEQSRDWPLQRLKAQAGVNLGGGDFRYCPTFQIEILPNIITEGWE